MFLGYVSSSRLSQQSCCDIPHICFLKFVVLAIISINIDIIEGVNNTIDVETHVHEAVDQILVVALVSNMT